MKFSEVIEKRRSVRHFRANQPVEDYHVRLILAAGVSAPSAGNIQPWRFTVVKTQEARVALAEALGSKWVATAPIVIVVSMDARQSYARYGDRGESLYAIQDTAAAAENMLLAAVDLGFSSCWIGAFNPTEVQKTCSIKAAYTPIAVLPIGVSGEFSAKPKRRLLDEVTTWI